MIDHGQRVVLADDALGRTLNAQRGVPGLVDVAGREVLQGRQVAAVVDKPKKRPPCLIVIELRLWTPYSIIFLTFGFFFYFVHLGWSVKVRKVPPLLCNLSSM